MSFRIALSGLNAASTDLEVTGNNIANASTNGFKMSRSEFADVYATSISDQSATAPGRGVRVARIAQQFGQGTVDFTSNNLDLALNGEGFFVLAEPDGTQFYTRAGAYSADRDGYVVNAASQRLQIYPPVAGPGGTTTFNTGALIDLQLPTAPGAPSATQNVISGLNLDATATAPPTAPFDPLDATSYTNATSISVYDSLGTSHAATLYFVRGAAAGQWDGYVQVSDGTFAATGTDVSAGFPLNFDSTGIITPATSSPVLSSFTPNNGANPLVLNMDFTNTTQYGTDFAVNYLNQDGFTVGRLAGVDIDPSGVVFGRYTNGQSDALGKVALAKFNNPQGLRPASDTNWTETFTSGNVQLGEAGTSSFGNIQSGALEQSNVDIAEQLVNLITAQRNFQANAQVISTSDQITQAVINLR